MRSLSLTLFDTRELWSISPTSARPLFTDSNYTQRARHVESLRKFLRWNREKIDANRLELIVSQFLTQNELAKIEGFAGQWHLKRPPQEIERSQWMIEITT